MLDDVKRIEKNPKRMRRICQTSVSECVRGKQIAELVVNFRLGHGEPRKQRQSRENRERSNGYQRKAPVSCELDELSLNQNDNRLAESGHRPCQSDTNHNKN
jgi:hypothetical protein